MADTRVDWSQLFIQFDNYLWINQRSVNWWLLPSACIQHSDCYWLTDAFFHLPTDQLSFTTIESTYSNYRLTTDHGRWYQRGRHSINNRRGFFFVIFWMGVGILLQGCEEDVWSSIDLQTLTTLKVKVWKRAFHLHVPLSRPSVSATRMGRGTGPTIHRMKHISTRADKEEQETQLPRKTSDSREQWRRGLAALIDTKQNNNQPNKQINKQLQLLPWLKNENAKRKAKESTAERCRRCAHLFPPHVFRWQRRTLRPRLRFCPLPARCYLNDYFSTTWSVSSSVFEVETRSSVVQLPWINVESLICIVETQLIDIVWGDMVGDLLLLGNQRWIRRG